MRISFDPQVVRETNADERDRICALAITRYRQYPWYMARCPIHGERIGLRLEFADLRGFREVLGDRVWCCGAFEREVEAQQTTEIGESWGWEGYLAWSLEWWRLRTINQAFAGRGSTGDWFHRLPLQRVQLWVVDEARPSRVRRLVELLVEKLLEGRRSPDAFQALSLARQFGAGGKIEPAALRTVWDALVATSDFGSRARHNAARAVAGYLGGYLLSQRSRAAMAVSLRELSERSPEFAARVQDAAGPPFPATICRPAWRTEAVMSVARCVRDEEQYELVPVLGDALEEAGCPEPEVRHCREALLHARGCWVLEWILEGANANVPALLR